MASGHFPVLRRTLNSDINTNMATLTSKIDTHDASIKSDITSSQNAITNAINAKGCVKSIQQFGGSFLLKNVTTEYRCNAVNVNKTLVYVVSGSTTGVGCYASLLSSTRVMIAAPDATTTTDGRGYFNIQLIEFY